MSLQIFCVGTLISCGVTLSTIDDTIIFDDNFNDNDSELAEDRDAYRAVAGWLTFVSTAGIISQVLLLVFHLLYYCEVFSTNFTVFAVIVSIYFSSFVIQHKKLACIICTNFTH